MNIYSQNNLVVWFLSVEYLVMAKIEIFKGVIK